MTTKLKQRIGIVVEDTDFNRRAAAYAKKAAKQAAALKYRRRKQEEKREKSTANRLDYPDCYP